MTAIEAIERALVKATFEELASGSGSSALRAAVSLASAEDRRCWRDSEMVWLRNEGWSLRAIGMAFPRNGRPMTKEGVRVALARAVARGAVVTVGRGRTPDRTNLHTVRSAARREEARRLFLGGMDAGSVAAELGVCGKTLRSYLGDLPEYAELRRGARRQPSRSRLGYAEIRTMRNAGSKLREIAERAGVTPSRVSQVLQEGGRYDPQAATAVRMSLALALLDQGLAVVEVSALVGLSPSGVYRYRKLRDAMAA